MSAGCEEKIRVCIVDYGSGNVGSVYNLISAITPDVRVSNSPDDIRQASHLVLPGVGAFGASMAKIRATLPLDVLEKQVRELRVPFLGICVGFQVLADTGHEFGNHDGLGWLGGRVERLPSGDLPLPHVGWNNIERVRDSVLLDGIRTDEDFYFVHSYVVRPVDQEDALATTTYGDSFVSVAGRDNIYGVQFHPEKSQRAGRRLLENFLSIR
jgi:glutamine amidotransferase